MMNEKEVIPFIVLKITQNSMPVFIGATTHMSLKLLDQNPHLYLPVFCGKK